MAITSTSLIWNGSQTRVTSFCWAGTKFNTAPLPWKAHSICAAGQTSRNQHVPKRSISATASALECRGSSRTAKVPVPVKVPRYQNSLTCSSHHPLSQCRVDNSDIVTPNAGLRLTRRGRVFVALVVLLFLVPMVSAAASVGVPSPTALLPTVEHVVAPGETLWEIAQYSKAANVGIGDAVSQIKRLNHLKTSDLHIGQTIVLPSG